MQFLGKKDCANFEIIDGIPAVRKCQKPRCATCFQLQEDKQIKFKDGINFNIHFSITCESFYLTYVLTCCGCLEHSIGKIADALRHRVTIQRKKKP